jgi:GntR family transcriptional repressor for pyruvate dehydrogenase complex
MNQGQIFEAPKLLLDRDSEPLFKQIAKIWRQKILSGEYKSGEPLPSERDMAEEFNVSRVPIREAMKALEYIGVIKHVRGKGVFVQNIDLGETFSIIGPFGVEPSIEVLRQLFDFRSLVEVNAAAEAAKHARPEDVEVLESLLEKTRHNVDRGIEEDSYDFHMKIVEMSKNQIAVLVTSFYSEILRSSRRATLTTQERRQEALLYHEQILQAIRDHDSRAAAFYMERHLKVAKERLPTQ